MAASDKYFWATFSQSCLTFKGTSLLSRLKGDNMSGVSCTPCFFLQEETDVGSSVIMGVLAH